MQRLVRLDELNASVCLLTHLRLVDYKVQLRLKIKVCTKFMAFFSRLVRYITYIYKSQPHGGAIGKVSKVCTRFYVNLVYLLVFFRFMQM